MTVSNLSSSLLTAAVTAVVLWAALLSDTWGIVALAIVVAALVAWTILRQRGREQASVPIGVLASVALCAVTPLTLVTLTSAPPTPVWVAPLCLAVAAGLRLAWLIADGAQRLVESMVWVFIYTFFGLAPLVQLRVGVDPETTPNVHHSLDAEALTVVCVGVLALTLGVFTAPRRLPPGHHADTAPAVRPERVTVLAFIGLAFAVYFITTVGLAALVSSRLQLNRVATAAWPNSTTLAVVRALAIMPLLVAFVALQVQKARGLSRGWFAGRALPIATGIVLLVVANPISNPRYTSGTAYLAVLASVGLVATRPRFRAVLAGFIVSLVLVFPLVDVYRYTTTASVKESDPVLALTTGDFDAYAQLVNTVQYVDVHGVTYGYQALGPLVFWIPRSIWSGKPVDTGILLAESKGYNFTNLSAPLWSELFINGGWLVLGAGMFLFGRLIRRWDGGIIDALRQTRAPGLLSCILPFYLLILLRGSLLQATAALALIAVSGWFVRERRPRLSWRVGGRGAVAAPVALNARGQ